LEDGSYRHAELSDGIVWELTAGLLNNDFFELVDKDSKRLRVELGITFDSKFLLVLL
jgi:hypothetical protein